MKNPEHILSVPDIDNAFHEGMNNLDNLWPERDSAPMKINVVELIDSIKLKLHMMAEKNLDKQDSAFERAAKKITGVAAVEKAQMRAAEQGIQSELLGKSPSQVAHEEAQRRMRRT